VRLLLDEMYPPALAQALRAEGIDASTVGEAGLAGRPDDEVVEAAAARHEVILTENVADFVRLAAERITAGGHHPGIVIALSSRFSRRPSGIPVLTTAIRSVAEDDLVDRILFLERR